MNVSYKVGQHCVKYCFVLYLSICIALLTASLSAVLQVVVLDQVLVDEMSVDQLSVNRFSAGGGWMLRDIDEGGWVCR